MKRSVIKELGVVQSGRDCRIDSRAVMKELLMDVGFAFHRELSWADAC